MATTYDILPDLRLVVTRHCGYIDGGSYRENYRVIMADPRFEAGFDELCIVADGTLFDLTLDDIRAVSDDVAVANAGLSGKIMVAVVLPPTVPDWSTTLYKEISEFVDSPERTEMFPTVDDAIAALERSGARDRILEVLDRIDS